MATNNLIIIAQMIDYIAGLMGVGLIIGSLIQLKKYGEMRSMMSHQMSITGPLVMLLAGSILLSLPLFIGVSVSAFFGDRNPLSLTTTTYDITPLIYAVRVFGVGSFVRGIVLLSRSGQQQSQPGMVGKALIHIFAGILCVHIIGTYELVKNTFFT